MRVDGETRDEWTERLYVAHGERGPGNQLVRPNRSDGVVLTCGR
jgi:hypothetical protein